jgi:hypothetical protein
MLQDFLRKYVKINRMQSRFDEQEEEAADNEGIRFYRITTAKKRASTIKLVILFALVLYIYLYLHDII